MKKRLIIGLILVFIMINTPLPLAQQEILSEPPSDPIYDFTALDLLLAQRAKDFGGIALIVSKDGEIIYDQGFEGMTSNTIIPIASASKWLSGGCLLAVIDNTSLTLDTPVSEYLDLFEGKKGEISLRQLFSHTSGIPPSKYSGRDVFDKTITLEESVDIISELDLIADPGSELWYGGFSMQVAGRIAEIAWLQQHTLNMTSGEAWMHIFEEMIATPLEMTDTDYHGLGETTNPRIAGSIQTSARQYLNFLTMLLNKGRYKETQVLTEESVNQMLTDQTRNASIMQSPWQEYESIKPGASKTRYGIGCWLEEMNTSSGNGQDISSHGAFGFGPWIDCTQNISGVFSVYYINGKTISTYFDVKRILAQILSETNQPPFPPSIVGPITGKVNKNQQFSVSLMDPDGDDLFYCIDWGDQSPMEWIGPYVNNTTLQLCHSWKHTSEYQVRVKAKDSSGSESDWESITVTISKSNMKYRQILQGIINDHLKDSIVWSLHFPSFFPRPPGQPTDGPGGSNYMFQSYTTYEYTTDAYRFFIFEPDAPKPSQAPVVVLYHRWFDADIENYKPLIRHLTGKGLIVIWPDYNPESTGLEEGVSNGLNIVVHALNELEHPGHVVPDLSHFGAIGHSFGASIAAAIGAQWQDYDLPSPSYLVLWCPGERGSEFIGNLRNCPSDCFFIQMVAEDDKTKHLATAQQIYAATSHITNNEIYIVQTDRYGSPNLIADHDSAGTRKGHPNALHFYGYWKMATAVALFKNNGWYSEHLQGSSDSLFMGQWSDGRDVNRMLFGIDNITSMNHERQLFQKHGPMVPVGLLNNPFGGIL